MTAPTHAANTVQVTATIAQHGQRAGDSPYCRTYIMSRSFHDCLVHHQALCCSHGQSTISLTRWHHTHQDRQILLCSTKWMSTSGTILLNHQTTRIPTTDGNVVWRTRCRTDHRRSRKLHASSLQLAVAPCGALSFGSYVPVFSLEASLLFSSKQCCQRLMLCLLPQYPRPP